MSDLLLIAGIDLGGTHMQIGIVGPDDGLLGRAKATTQAKDGPDAVLDRMAQGVREACAAAGVDLGDLAAVGVGAPGAIDHDHGIVRQAPNLGWDDYPLAQRLEKALGLPVVLDNDVNAAVLGEHRLGAGRGASDLLGVWIGTGVGGGLILGGSLFYGAVGSAGEIGQMVLRPDAPHGSRTLENNCSRRAVVHRVRMLVEAGEATTLMDAASIGPHEIAKACAANDELVLRVVDEAAAFLGATIGSVVTLLSLSRVVLGGGLTEALGEPFVAKVKRAVDECVFPEALRSVEIVATQLNDDAGLHGAAILARERFSR